MCEDLTLNDGQQDDDDKEEEGDVEEDAIIFILVLIGRLDLVADATAGSHTFVQMKYEALGEGIFRLSRLLERAPTRLTVHML